MMQHTTVLLWERPFSRDVCVWERASCALALALLLAAAGSDLGAATAPSGS